MGPALEAWLYGKSDRCHDALPQTDELPQTDALRERQRKSNTRLAKWLRMNANGAEMPIGTQPPRRCPKPSCTWPQCQCSLVTKRQSHATPIYKE